jgi:brefeldin A-inhibited guanine nucleotide-exchange protein
VNHEHASVAGWKTLLVPIFTALSFATQLYLPSVHLQFPVEMETERDPAADSVADTMDDMAEVSLDEPEQPEVVDHDVEQERPEEDTLDGPAAAVDSKDQLPPVPEKDSEPVDPPQQPDQNGTSSTPELAIQREQPSPVTPSQPSVDSPPVTRPPSSVFGNHMRSQSSRTSISLSRSSLHGGPQLSAALIIPGLETIADSKEAKKTPALQQAAQKALDLCKGNEAYTQPRAILEPLRLACETHSEKLIIAALDLLAKLVSHSFFQEDTPPEGQPPLADLIAHIITMSYTENSSPAVGLQVVKALLSLVLSPTLLIHQSSLLKAVRTVYNVYLLSSDTTNQMIAQGGLTQMVHHIFARIDREAARTRPATPRLPSGYQNGRTPTPVSGDSREAPTPSSGNGVLQEQQEQGEVPEKPTLTV